MRRLWAAALAPALGLAFVVMASGPADAFGSEVLGCWFTPQTWTAGSCTGQTQAIYSVHNLSGTYSYAWTFTMKGTPLALSSCAPPNGGACIASGCTATSSTCTVNDSPLVDRTITATVRLTQSGLSRSISASATFQPDGGTCGGC